MATWVVRGDVAVGSPHSFAAANTLSDTGAAYFGGGSRASVSPFVAITVNTWNSSMHIFDNVAIDANDKCANPHLNLCKVCEDTPASFYPNDSSVPVAFSPTNPTSGYGLRWHFNHGVACEVNPAQFWVGAGADAGDAQATAYFRATELLKTTPQWAAASPDSKYTLQTKTSGTDHYWYIVVGVKPLEVGVNTSNSMKISVTYS